MDGTRARGDGRRLSGRAANGGNVAMIFSLALPVLLVTGLGGVQLNQVMTDKKRTQDAADSAALMGASQIAVTPGGVEQRTQAYALAQLADVSANATVTVQASGGTGGVMTVAVDTQRVSFFGNLLPLGGFHTHVTSTAKAVNSVPLCVLTTGTSNANDLHISGLGGSMQAGQCLVHSDSAIAVDGGSQLQASASEAATSASGAITPAANVGAPGIKDPFSALSVNASCSSAKDKTVSATTTLQPATYKSLTINGGSSALTPITVTFAPGDYYFCGSLSINNVATVSGTDVVLVFAKSAAMTFSGAIPGAMGFITAPIGPSLNLSGRQSGPLAGFAVIADRTYTGSFQLQSDYITMLTGTVYVPTATLQVQGTALSGSASPWTVVTALGIAMTGGAQLVINSNYSASSVPVPQGVGGNRGSGSQLTQ